MKLDFILAYFLVLTVPGLLAARVLNIDRGGVLIWITLSLTVFTLNLYVARLLQLPIWSVWVMLILELAAAAALLGRQGIWSGRWFRRLIAVWPTQPGGKWVSIVALLGGAAYVIGAGPYLEVPADNWFHIGRLQNLHQLIDQQDTAAFYKRLYDAPHVYGYFIVAGLAHLLGYKIVDILDAVYFLNTLLFLAGFYFFAVYVFERMKIDGTWLYVTAALSTFFLVTQFGVNIFSYIRYYVFAPGFLNYLIYLGVIVIVTSALEHKPTLRHAMIVVLCTLAAALIHLQEAIFACLMVASIVLVAYFQDRFDQSWDLDALDGRPKRSVIPWLFYPGVMAVAACWIYSYLTRTRSNPLAYNAGISLEQIVPFIKNLYILNPTGQFFEVVTIWGVLVYILFFVYPEARKDKILLAGMITPVLTVFNPFFVDLYLRYSYSDALWRFAFMIPLPLAGGFVFSRCLRTAAAVGKPGSFRIASVVAAALLLVLLLPFSTNYVESRFSRLPTLVRTPAEVGHQQWADLFAYLETQKKHSILTDQVTGYMINALTKHDYRGHKFYGRGSPRMNKKIYAASAFADYIGWLIVVNRRDGGLSANGARARHWPENILKMRRYYSSALIRHIESNPEKYDRLWGVDDIAVYRIES